MTNLIGAKRPEISQSMNPDSPPTTLLSLIKDEEEKSSGDDYITPDDSHLFSLTKEDDNNQKISLVSIEKFLSHEVCNIEILSKETSEIGEIIIIEAISFDSLHFAINAKLEWQVIGADVESKPVSNERLVCIANAPGEYVVKVKNEESQIFSERRIQVMGKISQQEKDSTNGAVAVNTINSKEIPTNILPPSNESAVIVQPGNKDGKDEIPSQFCFSSQEKETLKKEVEYIPPKFADHEVSPMERKITLEKISEKKKKLSYRMATLIHPIGNADAFLAGGSYTSIYLAAQAFQEGRIRDGIVWLLSFIVTLLTKYGTEKGPLTKTLENYGKKIRNRYDDVKKTLVKYDD